MLYTKQIDQITYEDVVTFCGEGTREGFNLDYKRELPTNNETLAKWIAAFANTYGGLLIIGINANDGLPEEPFQGFDFDENISYDEKILSVILSYIHQPVFPEVKVCDPVDGKSFIVIRIAESELTPHRIGDRVRIYIRTGEISNPIDEANWEKLEWLKLRRKNSIELRKSLIEESDESFKQAIYNKHGISLIDTIGIEHPCVLSLKILPLFPGNSLVGFTELMDVDRFIQLSGGKAVNDFPNVKGHFEPIKNGVQNLNYQKSIPSPPISSQPLFHSGNMNDKFIYVLLNNLGLYVYKDKLGYVDDENYIFDFFSMVQYLCLFLKSSTKFFFFFFYWRSVYLQVELNNLSDFSILNPSLSSASSITPIPTNNLKWERKLTMKELETNRLDIDVELISDISWSLGLNNFNNEQVRDFLTGQLYSI